MAIKQDLNHLSLNVAKNHLKKILSGTKITPFLWGPPGVGKSSIVKQIAQEWQWELIDLRLSLLNPVDLRGLPYLDKEKNQATWLRPEFLPTKGEGILFLDELNTAPASVQIAAYQLILDRRVGSYVFPDGWRIICAGNRESDGAQVTKMPVPLLNRMIHIDVRADLDDWKIWAKDNMDERIIAFINWRPELLATMPKDEEKAFPTPRSWAFVSDLVSAYEDISESKDIIAGTVGAGASAELFSFFDIYQNLPDVDKILEGKISEVPKKADVKYALVSALVAKLKDQYLDNFVKYTLNLEPEFATVAIRDAVGKGWEEKIEKSKHWEEWANKFYEFL